MYSPLLRTAKPDGGHDVLFHLASTKPKCLLPRQDACLDYRQGAAQLSSGQIWRHLKTNLETPTLNLSVKRSHFNHTIKRKMLAYHSCLKWISSMPISLFSHLSQSFVTLLYSNLQFSKYEKWLLYKWRLSSAANILYFVKTIKPRYPTIIFFPVCHRSFVSVLCFR